ncbi:transcriptional regulator [Enterococcus ureilyticus]|uniref:Transcriptional regulator n=1 Tax=Enterococcus ureilyticus TaxID=1131292 RepID=A0A1E5HFD6_9ENTE|nr:winged helix-turn-helix domain-containing protein [Enterococcus ureilyticus]MBM7690470.1 two-component system response regulator VicR [Enterococcus ureilyticus]MBO0444941.1 response regulator transcription factor [Enterococcus ureilyticus]OEG23651.1 transcriptional regulator [Enterococcus ureilyticus]
MYNIGFVLLDDDTNEQKYIDSLNSAQLHVHPINKNEVIETNENYNGIVINEYHIQNIGLICELILSLKKKTDIFIWVISKRENKMNHIVYLQLGADGIIDPETDTEESKLLMINTFNRYSRMSLNDSEQISKSEGNTELQLRPCNFSVLMNGEEISLTKLEFKTIEFLQTQKGVAVSYEEIYKNVWENDGNDKQYRVSNLIFHLRQKIEKDAAHPNYIKTVRSKGYKLTL